MTRMISVSLHPPRKPEYMPEMVPTRTASPTAPDVISRVYRAPRVSAQQEQATSSAHPDPSPTSRRNARRLVWVMLR
jgi:hypothetical protein